jgi:glycosyltransferase involved in cell wall biosynthesis
MDKQLRVAMIGVKRISSRETGVEVMVEKLAKDLVSAGNQVTVYNRAKRGYVRLKQYSGIKIVTVPTINSKGLDAPIYAALSAIHAAFSRYDILHYHAEGSCFMLFLVKLLRKRVIVTIHGLDWQRSKWGGIAAKFIKFGEKQAVRWADKITVLSRNMQEYFKVEYGKETVYIPNEPPQPQFTDDSIIRDKWGLERYGYILFVGRLVPEKGLHDLIDAYRDIDTEKWLVIAGESSHTDGYAERIMKKAKADQRILFTGFVEGDMLASLFTNCYCYILPSEMEGMSISLLEALSYGCCCLVSDIPENQEVVGDRGAAFATGDVEDLRNKLNEILKSDVTRKAVQFENRNSIDYNKLYRECIEC